MPRLFTGIEIPPEIQEELDDLTAPIPGVHWIDTDDLHLTLRFAGDVSRRMADEFAELLAGIEIDAFGVRLSGLGTFGGKDPRAIWVGVEAGAELDQLARANERAARGAGLPRPEHAFKPHVTLGRVRHAPVEEIAAFLGSRGAYRSETFTVERFVMFSARPGTGGGPYVVESDFPLRGIPSEAWQE